MVIDFKKSTPLYDAFIKQEKVFTEALQVAANKAADAMGDDFAKVYHRSAASLLASKKAA